MSTRLSEPGRLALAALAGFVGGMLIIGLLVLAIRNESQPCMRDILEADVKISVDFYEEATAVDLEYLQSCGFK